MNNRRIKSVLYTNLIVVILPEDLSVLCPHIPVSEATQPKLLQTETQTNKSIFKAEIKYKGNNLDSSKKKLRKPDQDLQVSPEF